MSHPAPPPAPSASAAPGAPAAAFCLRCRQPTPPEASAPPPEPRVAGARPNFLLVSAALRGFFMHEECDGKGCHLFPNSQRLVEEQLFAVFEARLLTETAAGDLTDRSAFDWVCKMAWVALQVRGRDGKPYMPKTIKSAIGVTKSFSPRLTREQAERLDEWAERMAPMRARELSAAEVATMERIREPLRIVATELATQPDAVFGARTFDLARRVADAEAEAEAPDPDARVLAGQIAAAVNALQHRGAAAAATAPSDAKGAE